MIVVITIPKNAYFNYVDISLLAFKPEMKTDAEKVEMQLEDIRFRHEQGTTVQIRVESRHNED